MESNGGAVTERGMLHSVVQRRQGSGGGGHIIADCSVASEPMSSACRGSGAMSRRQDSVGPAYD